MVPLEQPHLDESSLFNRALIGRDLDVAVRLRQARDFSRALERRGGDAVLQPDRVELVSSGWGRDSSTKPGVHGARSEDRQPRAWRAGRGRKGYRRWTDTTSGCRASRRMASRRSSRMRSASPASPQFRERSSVRRAATRSTIRSRSPTELPPENTMMSALTHESSAALSASIESWAGRADRECRHGPRPPRSA